MARCKDCIHFGVCKKGFPWADGKGGGWCEDFKDRSMFLALPCPIGSTVYVIGHRYRAGRDECWINTGKLRPSDLEKIGERVFLTYEDAKAKILSTNKGNSRLLFVERLCNE